MSLAGQGGALQSDQVFSADPDMSRSLPNDFYSSMRKIDPSRIDGIVLPNMLLSVTMAEFYFLIP